MFIGGGIPKIERQAMIKQANEDLKRNLISFVAVGIGIEIGKCSKPL